MHILYIIALLLFIGWAIGFFAFALGGLIHLLLALAVISMLIRMSQGKKPV
jgi:hypothetical protein